jgi:hypothetical protein
MRRIALALAALLGAFLIAWAASQPPAALPGDAPADRFSGVRAMADIKAISRAPRPAGSAENARVRGYLLTRMRQLGMAAAEQSGPLPARSAEKLRERGRLAVAPTTAVNVIGLLPGRDRAAPAVLLMAHHDSVPFSPGAADDAAGVAAALEIVRAIKARGVPQRDVAILFTDAEEAGLVGVKMFFEAHPLARRIGAIVNMEARGGGGRTAMFETGRDNGAMVELYRRSVSRPSSNSLAVLIYELMPNNTDFTIPKERDIAGFNFAFIGEGRYYHSPASTPEALDPATVQDLGTQALEVTRALALAPELPPKAKDAVFGDVLGLFVISYRPLFGWAVLGLAAGLIGFAWARVRPAAREVGIGAAAAVALVLLLALLLRGANLVSGSGGPTNYYDRLAALPRLELQAAFVCIAVLLLAPLALRARSGVWGGWIGLASPVFVLALAAQLIAPTAAPVLAWPLLLAGLFMAVAAFDAELKRKSVRGLLAILGALAGAQILYLAHLTFLGIGAKLPEVMALYALLIALLFWPLLRRAASRRGFAAAAAMLLVAATGIALSVRLDPLADTVPPYSEAK